MLDKAESDAEMRKNMQLWKMSQGMASGSDVAPAETTTNND